MATLKNESAAEVIADYDILINILKTEEEEFKNIEELTEVEGQISKLREAREKCIQEQIENLTKTFEKEEHSLHNVQQEKVSEELEQLKRELELASENSDHIKLQIGELQKKITERKEIMEDFIGKQQALDHKINKTIPSSQHDLQLYRYLTGIRWQMDTEEHEVKGYISSKNKVKTFSFNRLQNSQFFITNYLWDQLETDW